MQGASRMTFQCSLGHTDIGAVIPSVDPRYATGFCYACRQRRQLWAEVRGERRKATGMAPAPHADPLPEVLKQQGMAMAALNADQGVDAAWRSAATQIVRILASQGIDFTINDVTDQVGLPSHRNATGSLLPTLARQGLIRKVGHARGTRASQHARDVALWRGAWAVEAA